jgi:predicted ferric reductase
MFSLRRARGPLSLIGLYLVTVVLWAGARPWSAWFATRASGLDALAIACGLVGLTAFALNIVLASRLRAIERWFGGLGALYRVHRANGRLAYFLIVAHVIFIFATRAQTSIHAALSLATPSGGRVVLLGVLAFVLMSVAIFATLRMRLSHEVFVYVQRMLGVVFLIAALHAFLTAGAKASSRPLTIYLEVVTLAALAAFIYRSLFGDVLVRRRNYVVTAARELDPSVVEITMKALGKPIEALPGQFAFATFYSDEFAAEFHPVTVSATGGTGLIVLRPGDVQNQFHPFSLTSAAGDPELKMAVKAVGGFTHALHRLRPGAFARVEGPYGEFSYLRMAGRTQVWVAGGIGITPFLSMARSLRSGDDYDIKLFYAVKTLAQAYFIDELREIASTRGTFSVTLVPEDVDGFVTAAELLDGRDRTSTEFLICGPPGMVEALTAQLRAGGVPPERVHGERFGFGPRT